MNLKQLNLLWLCWLSIWNQQSIWKSVLTLVGQRNDLPVMRVCDEIMNSLYLPNNPVSYIRKEKAGPLKWHDCCDCCDCCDCDSSDQRLSVCTWDLLHRREFMSGAVNPSETHDWGKHRPWAWEERLLWSSYWTMLSSWHLNMCLYPWISSVLKLGQAIVSFAMDSSHYRYSNWLKCWEVTVECSALWDSYSTSTRLEGHCGRWGRKNLRAR